MKGVPLPANWPGIALALILAILAAYLLAGVVARFVSATLQRIHPERDTDPNAAERPERLIRGMVFLVTAAALSFPALKAAGLHTAVGSEPEALGRWFLEAGLRIVIIGVVAYFVVRMGTAAARRLEREMSRGTGLDVIERTKRAQTLSRLMQTALTVTICAIAALMMLRQLDIDITPALTGAGIVGLAVGFGGQTLVRDIISGFFIILEDQVRVGDVAVVNGQGGLVEAVNLRTIVLRDEEGTVHVIPNGEIKTLANKSKDFSFYIIVVTIPLDEDPERVMQAMRDAAATLMTDPNFRPNILEPLDVYGIDNWDSGQMTIKSRIKTVPLKQWMVGRELRRRMAYVFAERGIDLFIPKMHLIDPRKGDSVSSKGA
jgi:small conductance mechanosensitive channel